jgi:hypothetical protein
VFGTIFAQKPNLEHNRKLDDLGLVFKIAPNTGLGMSDWRSRLSMPGKDGYSDKIT